MINTEIPVVNEDPTGILSKSENVFALDMDGTIYLGERWIDGAKEFLERIEASGRNYVFLTNNSSKNAAVYVEKLERMGLSVGEEKNRHLGTGDDPLPEMAFSRQESFSFGQCALAGGVFAGGHCS